MAEWLGQARLVQVCLKITEALRMLIGYARVSKTEQNLDLQIDALKAAGCDPRRIFTDKQSGAKWDRRGLDAAMSHLREGDTLVVWEMDRLGRTVLQSVQFLTSLHKEKGDGNDSFCQFTH